MFNKISKYIIIKVKNDINNNNNVIYIYNNISILGI